jgi:predicted metalloprotease
MDLAFFEELKTRLELKAEIFTYCLCTHMKIDITLQTLLGTSDKMRDSSSKSKAEANKLSVALITS